jgi:hypothetical protein
MDKPHEVFVPVFGVIFTDSQKRGLSCFSGAKIYRGKKKDKILKKLEPLRESIGSLELRSLGSAEAVVHARYEYSEMSEAESQFAVLNVCRLVEEALSTLWLIKDCSPFTDQAYLVNFEAGALHAHRTVDRVSLCNGESRPVRFTAKEIEGAFRSVTTSSVADSSSSFESLEKVASEKFGLGVPGSSRLQRASGFVGAARNTPDLPLKVAHYCSALEAALSSGTGELKYKVSERAALLYPKDSRDEIFTQVKEIYDVRSRVLHGDTVPKKKNIARIASNSDSVCRYVLQELFDGPEALVAAANSKERLDLERHFLSIILQA